MKNISSKNASDRSRATLHGQGFRATPGRMALLMVLQKTKNPLTVEEVMATLNGRGGDQATVYRMLKAFKKSGIVRQIDFQHGHAHYELSALGDHHHIICIKCEAVEDVKGCQVDRMAEEALKKSRSFASVTEHALELFGICKKCH